VESARQPKEARRLRDDREFGAWLHEHHELLRTGWTAIDLGCGVGADAEALIASGMRVFGMDLSRSRVARASRRVPGGHFIVGNFAAGLPFRAEFAHLVVSSLSLHYFDLRTTHRIVKDIVRVLIPGGYLLCRVNVVGDEASLYGSGTELEPDLFALESGRLKRFFTDATLRALLTPYLAVEMIERRDVQVRGDSMKQTLVARAMRT
jgi:SAM-dependent methyltransferase